MNDINLGIMRALQNKSFAQEFEYTFDLKAIQKEMKEDKKQANKNLNSKLSMCRI